MTEDKVVMQSGVVPYRLKKGKPHIVLITARNTDRNWILPKGHLEKGFSPEDSAAREAYEEAGVKGAVAKQKVGSVSYSKLGRKYKVGFYLMRVSKICKKWPEMSERQRLVVPADEALRLACDSKVKHILLDALTFIDKAVK